MYKAEDGKNIGKMKQHRKVSLCHNPLYSHSCLKSISCQGHSAFTVLQTKVSTMQHPAKRVFPQSCGYLCVHLPSVSSSVSSSLLPSLPLPFKLNLDALLIRLSEGLTQEIKISMSFGYKERKRTYLE